MQQLQQTLMSRSIYLLRLGGREVLQVADKGTCVQRSVVGDSRTFLSTHGGRVMVPQPRLLQAQKVNVARRSMAGIAEEGVGTHKPSAFQKRTMVLAKMYPSIDKVPDRVTRNQLSVAMDKFRVRACIIMVAVTFIAAAIVAMVGRRERHERQQGKPVTTLGEARGRGWW